MNKKTYRNGGRIAICTLVSTLSISIAASSHAEELTGFYDDETLVILTPWAPGGGADIWARYIASTIGPYLGGGANVQVVNRPGAGGVQGTNEFQLRTAEDGMTVLLQSAGQVFPFMYGSRAVQYDFRDYEPLVAQSQGGVVYVRSDLGIDEPQQLWDAEHLIYGEVSPQAQGSITLAAFALLDLSHDVVFGYESRGPARLAIEQGETNIDYQSTSAYNANVQPLVEEGLMKPMFSFGVTNSRGEMVRDPAFPELPTVLEVYEARYGSEPSGLALDAYRAVLSAGMIKMLWAKPGASEDSIHDLRVAFDKARNDETFLADSAEANGPYEWLVGDEAYDAMSVSLEVSDEAVEFLRNTFKEQYNADL